MATYEEQEVEEEEEIFGGRDASIPHGDRSAER